MKKLFLTLTGIFCVLVLTVLLLPVLLKGPVTAIVEEQVSRHPEAELTIGKIRLDMFKNFPNLHVFIENIMITGNGEFAKDTLARIPAFDASVNVLSFIKGKEIIINKLLIRNATLKFIRSTTGKNNWDIGKHAENNQPGKQSVRTKPKNKNAGKAVRFNNISFRNLTFSYRNDISHTYAGISSLSLYLSGNFAETNTVIKTDLRLENVSLQQNQTHWINHTNLRWQSEIKANLQEFLFHIPQSCLFINELKMNLASKLNIREDRYDVDFQLNTPDSGFENLLALLPQKYRNDLKNIKTDGTFSFQLTTTGSYYQNHLPAFQAQLSVCNAGLQYAGLPEALQQINLDLNIHNPGGATETTEINLKQLSFLMDGNPFRMQLLVKNPRNPVLQGGIKGTIGLGSLNNILPLQNIVLQGTITSDLVFQGEYAYAEKEQYDKFQASGDIRLKDIFFKNRQFPEGISIPQADISITPTTLRLNQLEAHTNTTDVSLQGTLSDYLPYLFQKQILTGDFRLHSRHIHLNEFLKDTLVNTPQLKDTLPATEKVPEIPNRIRLLLHTDIQSLQYDQLSIRNLKGKIELASPSVSFSDLNMDLLNGTVKFNGKYNRKSPYISHIDLDIAATGLDINEAGQTFPYLAKNVPIMMNCEGKINAAVKLSSDLNRRLELLTHTADGKGDIASQGIVIRENPALLQLASLLKNEELNRLSISSFRIDFDIRKGNLTIPPFQTTLAGNAATIYGSQTANGNLNYTLSLNIKRKFFGEEIDKLLKALPGSDNIESLDVDVKITGDTDRPVIKPDLSKAVNTLRKEAEKELKKKAKKNLLKELNKLFK